MSGDWSIIETGAGDAAWNMAVDWALLQLRGEGKIPDTLRFYTWNGDALSLGYSQDILRELDLERCRRRGVSTVFRPTGGALVLHHFDLTYSIVLGMPGLDPGAWADFSRLVARVLRRWLQGIGIEAAFVEGGMGGGRRNHGACFLGRGRHEITVLGRKIVGNARRWSGGALLQHGSIVIRRSPVSVVDLMAGMTEEEREETREELERKSTSLEEETGRVMEYEELWPSLLAEFERSFHARFKRRELMGVESSRARACMERAAMGPAYRLVRRGLINRSSTIVGGSEGPEGTGLPRLPSRDLVSIDAERAAP